MQHTATAPHTAPHTILRLLLIAGLSLSIGACGLIKNNNSDSNHPALSDADIKALLAKGDAALADNRLTTPADDNAMLYYSRILDSDAENEEANERVHKVAARYLALANRDYRSGKTQQAINYLEHAEDIGGINDDTLALRKKIEQNPVPAQTSKAAAKPAQPAANNAGSKPADATPVTASAPAAQPANSKPTTTTYPLSIPALDKRDDEIKDQLVVIARNAQQRHSMAVITARSYFEGRWIANTLRDAVPDYTLQTEQNTGEQPSIVLKPATE